MLYLTELEIVNGMLAVLGELPLNHLDEEHSLVPAARQYIKEATFDMQSDEWWFNSEHVQLGFDPHTGRVACPGDAMKTVPLWPHRHLVQRGKFLYDPTRTTYSIGQNVNARIVRYVPYEDLPLTAQRVVGAQATFAFCKAFDADETKLQQVIIRMQAAQQSLNRENTRQQRTNLLEAPAHVMKKQWIRGGVRRNRPF